MPSFISLSGLSLTTADGLPFLTDLTLTFGPERTGLVGANGTGKSTLLALIASGGQPVRGRIERAGTLAMMRQDLRPRAHETIANLFGARAALDLIDRAEAGRAGMDELARADWTLPARMEAALMRAGLETPPDAPLAQLSGGQRTRAALAAAIFAKPDMLLMDEPTNNLDAEGRRAVGELIAGWQGGAIVASHDRALLQGMDAIVELTSLGAARFGGGYSSYRARKDTELDAARRDLAHAEGAANEAARRAQEAAERKARRDGAGQRSRASGSQPKMLLDARKARAEASGAAGRRLRAARAEAADSALETARARLEVIAPLSMALAPSQLPPGRVVLRAEDLSYGHPGAPPLFTDLSLTLTGPERVVIEGPNGSGKTTLLRLLIGRLAPQAGHVARPVPGITLDQQVTILDPALPLAACFAALNPGASAQDAHAALARFGFRAGAAGRRAGSLSGGERLRAGLACTLGAPTPPQLLVLDEPTNHLDLDGIAALEAALAGYDGAVLAVSHDTAFLASLAPQRSLRLPQGRIRTL